MTDLTRLPPPNIIEPLDFATILSRMKQELTTRDPDFSALLESDPAVKILEVAAWRELLLRQRINEAAAANLLAFATLTDLDHLGAFYDVIRQDTETDERFRHRIQTKLMGWSTAGSRDYYRYHALSSDVRVQDARVISPKPGFVQISILAEDIEAVLNNVRTHVGSDTIRMLTDTLEVVGCSSIPLTIKAIVYLKPQTPPLILDTIKIRFIEQLNLNKGLGWSVTTSWIIAHLFAEGVQRVELLEPTADITVPADAYVTLAEISLRLAP